MESVIARASHPARPAVTARRQGLSRGPGRRHRPGHGQRPASPLPERRRTGRTHHRGQGATPQRPNPNPGCRRRLQPPSRPPSDTRQHPAPCPGSGRGPVIAVGVLCAALLGVIAYLTLHRSKPDSAVSAGSRRGGTLRPPPAHRRPRRRPNRPPDRPRRGRHGRDRSCCRLPDLSRRQGRSVRRRLSHLAVDPADRRRFCAAFSDGEVCDLLPPATAGIAARHGRPVRPAAVMVDSYVKITGKNVHVSDRQAALAMHSPDPSPLQAFRLACIAR